MYSTSNHNLSLLNLNFAYMYFKQYILFFTQFTDCSSNNLDVFASWNQIFSFFELSDAKFSLVVFITELFLTLSLMNGVWKSLFTLLSRFISSVFCALVCICCMLRLFHRMSSHDAMLFNHIFVRRLPPCIHAFWLVVWSLIRFRLYHLILLL